jgi:hypothetical protein
MNLRNEVRLALAVPRWAWRTYRRHWPVVVGLSLIPSVQRLVVMSWEDHLPTAVAVASEVVVMAVRLLLLAVVWRLAMAGGRLGWAHCRAFAAKHWPSLVVQGALLSVAALVFDAGLEQVVGGLLPESARQNYLAALLFVKNPTIIAFTFVWMVGAAKQLLRQPTASTRRREVVG